MPGVEDIGNGAPAGCIFLPHLPLYAADSQERILTTHAQSGYTHATLSWPDARGRGKSIEDYVRSSQRVNQFGQFAGHFFGSKDFDPWNDDENGWPARCADVIDALQQADAIQYAVVGWELGIWNIPGDVLYAICRRFRRMLDPKIPLYVHFQTEAISWQKNGEDSLSFWHHMADGTLDGIFYQADVKWSMGMLQARINDGLERFGGSYGPLLRPDGKPFEYVVFEDSAENRFAGEITEDRQDLIGLAAMLTQGPIACAGYGNGCRKQSGEAF